MTGLCRACLLASQSVRINPATVTTRLEGDRTSRHTAKELVDLRQKYKAALTVIDTQQRALATATALHTVTPRPIVPHQGASTSEGTVVIVASDWHIEERVGKELGGLNTYSTDIAKNRADRFFQSGLRLLQLLQQDLTISTVVLALLGDFISNDIHEEFPEINSLTPTHALSLAQDYLVAGLEFLLAHTTVQFILPCHSGNHARTTRTTRFSAENGHSLEYMMYVHLATYFRSEKRVTFLIAEGMHSYLKVYDTTIRFQHGHAIKYGGGIGGIYIPVNKAIAQWNKAKHADLDVFGHFHQARDGGNFLSNGSLIGYNAFALSIKADFEPPKQQLFLLDKKRGRTCTWPILVS